jgi:surface antigen
VYAIDAFWRSGAAARHPSGLTSQTEEVRAISRFRNQNGQLCHVVEDTVAINGQRERVLATVCQQHDGIWMLQQQSLQR